MKKLCTVFCWLISFSLSAQTLFYYGNDSVSVNEFLRAYNKNNTGTKTEKAVKDYLNLYIASKLKVKEARQRGYDTLPQMVSDIDNLRRQILPAYLDDKAELAKLVEEAFIRSQKNIHLAHIFISFVQNGRVDSAASLKKVAEVQTQLQSGADFGDVAKKYSDDPSAKQNAGDLNWITVFSLPYELENLAYSIPVGKISPVYKSRAGYHVFKNIAERKGIGRLKAAQILFAFPPNADNQTKQNVKRLVDSVYNRLLKGDDFATLASQFSNDMYSSSAGGQMQEFGAGHYDPVFESVAFALTKDGEISRPFQTSYGWHIVKRISKTPAINRNDTKAMADLQSRVEQSDRIQTTRNTLAKKVLKDAGFKKAPFTDAELWALSDSILNYKRPEIPIQLTATSTVFQLGNKNVQVADWISYAQTFRYKSDGSGMKSYPQVWNEFLDAMALDHYQNHLEEYNEEFRHQLNEFRDGNLFFEIMQKEVWGPAQNDSVALIKYYEKHRNNYVWRKSADAVIFYANDIPSAKTFSEQLKKSPKNWKDLLMNFDERIAADSSRFELSQIPNPFRQNLLSGTVTAIQINKADNSASLAYIIRVYNKTEPRNFADARGLVITDYQAELEKKWNAELQKKYPVRINDGSLRIAIARAIKK